MANIVGLATKAVRDIFELQARISAMRQVGIIHKIARTIEQELNRYIRWAMKDASLDKLEFMSNIAIKRFDSAATGMRTMNQQVQDFFQGWAAEYRDYYAARPQIQKPPRVLYGLVIIQHGVALLTMDSAKPGRRAKIFGEFNMAQENQWLESSILVAIPICMARDRLVRMAEAGTLQEKQNNEREDEDA